MPFITSLEESTQTMTMTSDLYTMFRSLLDTSKTLVTALEKSDWLDRLLLLSSLAFFLLVVAYILKKRVIDKGIWLAFWWVKYLPLPKSSASSTPPSILSSQPQVLLQSTTVANADSTPANTVSSLLASSIAAAVPAAASSAVISHLASGTPAAVHGSVIDSITFGNSPELGIGDEGSEPETVGSEEAHLEFDTLTRTEAVYTHEEL